MTEYWITRSFFGGAAEVGAQRGRDAIVLRVGGGLYACVSRIAVSLPRRTHSEFVLFLLVGGDGPPVRPHLRAEIIVRDKATRKLF